MDEFIRYWLDVIWLPILFMLVHKQHRWWTLGFGFACLIMLRMQTEIFNGIHRENGIMGVISTDVHTRAQITYSVFYILFLLMAHYSPGTKGVVFMAACIAVFFMAFVTSTLVMAL